MLTQSKTTTIQMAVLPATLILAHVGSSQVYDPYPDIQFSSLQLRLETTLVFPGTNRYNPSTFPGWHSEILQWASLSGSTVSFASDVSGKLYKIENGEISNFLNVAEVIGDSFEYGGWTVGLASFAFHPAYLENGKFYTIHAEAANTSAADYHGPESGREHVLQSVVTEWITQAPLASTFSGTRRELLRVDQPRNNHPLSTLSFNPHAAQGEADYGMLYIASGDGGSITKPWTYNSGRLDSPLGCILRIDPDGSNATNGAYGIPHDNPFVDSSNHETIREIWAYGFRNPAVMSWDKTVPGRLYVSDIGESNVEEVNLVTAGGYYGFPKREGIYRFDGNTPEQVWEWDEVDDSAHTAPLAAYDHDDGAAIAGGFVYRGSLIPELYGLYLFGDIRNGRIFFFDPDLAASGEETSLKEAHIHINGVEIDFIDLVDPDGSGRADLRIFEDEEGELYLYSKQDGVLRKIIGTNLGNRLLIARKLGVSTTTTGQVNDSWFGSFKIDNNGWIEHEVFGWLYTTTALPTWVYSPIYGWWYLSRNYYPWIYMSE